MNKTIQDRDPDRIEDTNRRKFLEIGIYTITGCIVAVSGVALTRFGVGPAFEEKDIKWVEADLLPEDIPKDTFEQVIVDYESKDGWTIAPMKLLAFIRKEPDGSIIAVSATCTHLGCVVSWHDAENYFKCPCHNGKYDSQGKVLSGPPPAPLRRHPVKIVDGQLFLAARAVPQGEITDEAV